LKIACIIQQRLGSTRLPGKALMDICGKTLTERVIERASRAKSIKEIYVAIPFEPNYANLWRNIRKQGVAVPLLFDNIAPADLVGRYHAAAMFTNSDIVIRIPADNPCVDPVEIDRIVECYERDPSPWNWLTTNLDRDVLGNGYPAGLGAEVYDARYFKWADKNVTLPRHREHPHFWAIDHGKVRTIQAPADIARPWLDFSVNTQADLDFIERIYRHVPEDFSARDVMRYLDTTDS